MSRSKLKIAPAVVLVAALACSRSTVLTHTIPAGGQAEEAQSSPPKLDLTKIDRTIRKEPVYRTKPRYALLVLGPKAATRMWLVVDGRTVYVARHRNCGLTEQ